MRGVFARYSPTGHLLVVTADAKLLAVPFDPDKLALAGPPIALVEGLGVGVGGFSVDLAVSSSGTLVYTSGGSAPSQEVVWVSREGNVTRVDSAWAPQGTINSLALSPDGRAVAVGLVKDGKENIWIKQLPSGPFSRITFGDTAHMRPSWSHDGRSVLFITDRTSGAGGFPTIKRADGTGAAQALLESRYNFGELFQSSDGRWLVIRRVIGEPGDGDIYGLPAGDTTLVPLVTTSAREVAPALSPDGRWLAYASNESGNFEVYVRPFPAVASARWQVSTAGGSAPEWARDGKELIYTNGRNDLVTVEVHFNPTFQVGQQKLLFSTTQYFRGPFYQAHNLTPDGRRFLMIRQGNIAEGGELILTQNWVQELKAREKK
jgi:serine/threonine-protein kinase